MAYRFAWVGLVTWLLGAGGWVLNSFATDGSAWVKPALAIQPVKAVGFSDPVTDALGSYLVDLVKRSEEFKVIDRKSSDEVLRLIREYMHGVYGGADPPRLETAGKALLSKIMRTERGCVLELSLTKLTMEVEASATRLAACDYQALTLAAREAWQDMLRGWVAITTDPPGLAVSIDRQPAAPVQGRISLPAGSHIVALAEPGYLPVYQRLDLHYGQEVAVHLRGELALAQLNAFIQVANESARKQRYQEAFDRYGEAISTARSLEKALTGSVREQMTAVILSLEGSQLVSAAWLAHDKGETERACDNLIEASARFEAAKLRLAEAGGSRLSMPVLDLIERRPALTLGACAPSIRFGRQVESLRWGIDSASPERLVDLDAAIARIARQPGLSSEQIQWLQAERALLRAVRTWARLREIDLLKERARWCERKDDVFTALGAARAAFERAGGDATLRAKRTAYMAAVAEAIGQQASICPR